MTEPRQIDDAAQHDDLAELIAEFTGEAPDEVAKTAVMREVIDAANSGSGDRPYRRPTSSE